QSPCRQSGRKRRRGGGFNPGGKRSCLSLHFQAVLPESNDEHRIIACITPGGNGEFLKKLSFSSTARPKRGKRTLLSSGLVFKPPAGPAHPRTTSADTVCGAATATGRSAPKAASADAPAAFSNRRG